MFTEISIKRFSKYFQAIPFSLKNIIQETEQYMILIELDLESKENIFKIAYVIRTVFKKEFAEHFQANDVPNLNAAITMEKFSKIGASCFISNENSGQLWEFLNKRTKLTGVLLANVLNDIYNNMSRNVLDIISDLKKLVLLLAYLTSYI